MFVTSRVGRGRRLLAVVASLGVLAGACGNSDDEGASGGTATATAGERDAGDPVPGVTDDEVRFSVLGTRSNNPLGTCILDCFLDGIEAYFAYRNSEGGAHGRRLVVAEEVDDALGENQVRALEIVERDETFAAFNASTLASGFPEFAEARMPLYVWALQHADMAGHDTIWGNREVVCIECLSRAVPYAARQAGAEQVATLGYGVDASSERCARSAAASTEHYGDEVGAALAYTNDGLAFGLPNGIGPEVTAMRDAGVDLVVGCLDLNGMRTLAEEMGRQGIGDVPLYHLNTYDQAFVAEAGDLFEGDYVVATFRPFEADPGASAAGAYEEWMAETGSEPSELAIIGWINADLAYQGILAAGPDFDRESVIAATNGFTDFTADGLTQPVDWSRQHEPWTDDDPAAHGPAQDCIALVQVVDGAFEIVGDAARPFTCWPGTTNAWSEPVPTDFD